MIDRGSKAPHIYLHMGRHKTGTTTLQRFLSSNEEALSAEGFAYPKTLRKPDAHHPLAVWYNRRKRSELTPEQEASDRREIEAFRDEIRNESKIILSSEAFQNARPNLMIEEFSGFDFTFIVYLREPLDYLLSAYAQRVKAGNTAETIEEFAARFKPDYDVFLKRWTDVFPDAKLHVRVFDRARLCGEDIRVDFLDCIGIEANRRDAFVYPDGDANMTIGGELLEFVRRLNLFEVDLGADYPKLYRASQSLAAHYPEYRRKPSMRKELQDEVRSRGAEMVATISEQFFDGQMPFSQKEFPVGDDAHRLSADAVDQILSRLEEEDAIVAKTVAARVASIQDFAGEPSRSS